MISKPDGGPAFPGDRPDLHDARHPGMSLRDWFAGMAMQGLLSSECDPPLDGLTAAAYEMADAMIAEREK